MLEDNREIKAKLLQAREEAKKLFGIDNNNK
jgi:hypothetical protein